MATPWINTYNIERESYVVKDFREEVRPIVARQRYILLKNTPELKKGAILEEDCDDGDQGFHVISSEWNQRDDQDDTAYTRKIVTEQAEWFDALTPFYMTKKQLEKVKDVLFPSKNKVVSKGRPKKR